MALNNLNNPYSPQPSTPVACHPEDHFPIVGPGGVTIMAPVNVVQGQNFGGGSVNARLVLLSGTGEELWSLEGG